MRRAGGINDRAFRVETDPPSATGSKGERSLGVWGERVLTAEALADWSGEAYDTWYEGSWGRYAFAVETEAVLSAVGPLPGRRVLAAGCGSGRLLSVLSAGCAAAVGLDPEPTMLGVAAKCPKAPLVRGDVLALPVPRWPSRWRSRWPCSSSSPTQHSPSRSSPGWFDPAGGW